jgi:hypothetical protein
MSENVTHTAVVDDCSRLAGRDPAVCGPIARCLAEHLDVARLGGITRAGDTCIPGLLASLRDRWPAEGERELTRRKLAFACGWLCHRAADRQMKPVFRAADPDCPLSPTDCSVYHDAFLLREVYGAGDLEPYGPAVLEPDPSAEGIEDLLRTLWQRALIALHTFIPDESDPEGWVERLLERRQRFRVDLRRYAEALASPDPQKIRRFIVDARFYDRSDPLIRLARSLREGAEEAIDLEGALAAAGEQSQYARALARGMRYLRAASGYFEGRLDEDEFRNRCDIGRPETPPP